MVAGRKTRLNWQGKPQCGVRVLLLASSCFIPFLVFVRTRNPPHYLIWDPRHVRECHEAACFLRALLPDSIPNHLARTACGYVSGYARRQPDVPAPFIVRSSNKRFVFSKCSVVGGAPSSQAQSYGKIIDSAPTIRLNVRYPPFLRAEGFSTLLGTRTDILLVQDGALGRFEWYTNGWGRGNTTLGRLRLLAGQTFITEKPLILYRTECPTNVRACIRSLKVLNTSTTPGRLPIWLIHHDVEILAKAALRRFGLLRNKIPSTGIAAVIIALRMCKHINVFGMSGSTKADGDFHKLSVWSGHDLDSERKFIHWVSTCSRLQNPWCGRVNVFS